MSIKPFYIMPSEDPKYSESFDLQKGMLELTSGGIELAINYNLRIPWNLKV